MRDKGQKMEKSFPQIISKLLPPLSPKHMPVLFPVAQIWAFSLMLTFFNFNFDWHSSCVNPRSFVAWSAEEYSGLLISGLIEPHPLAVKVSPANVFVESRVQIKAVEKRSSRFAFSTQFLNSDLHVFPEPSQDHGKPSNNFFILNCWYFKEF